MAIGKIPGRTWVSRAFPVSYRLMNPVGESWLRCCLRFTHSRSRNSVRSGTFGFLALAGAIVGCAGSTPRQFGQTNDFGPRVAPQNGERIPQHVTVQLTRPANVAVFLVVPGRGSTLLFPADSNQNGFVQSGSHLVETSLARGALSDSSRLIRRPSGQQGPPGTRPTPSNRTRTGRDTMPGFGYSVEHGFLLIYASQDPMPYSILSTRVSGISIPIEDNDALNTVTKLIRQSTRQSGPWAAFATSFPP